MAVTLVSTVTIGSGGAASIEFTNIPQTGTDLAIVYSLRNSGGNSAHNLELNGDTTSGNYSSRMLTGNGNTIYTYSLNKNIILTTYSPDSASTFSNGAVYLHNYADSTSKQTIAVDTSTENAGTYVAGNAIVAGHWTTNSAVTSVKLQSQDTWVQYSTASLYIIS